VIDPADQPAKRSYWSRSFTRAAGRWYGRLVRAVLTMLGGIAFAVIGVTFLNYVVLSTPKDRAYRDIDPNVTFCREGLEKGWTILADQGRARAGQLMQADDGGWADPTDDEAAVVARDASWGGRFSCALQHHVVPSAQPRGRPLDYYLGFLELKEDGEPYALVSADAGSTEIQIDAAMLQHAAENQMRQQHMAASQVNPMQSQLDVLERHLATGSNLVLVFIHGWRHDAHVGDSNVADLRLYAAHVARFIRQRCAVDPSYCDMRVTAIYVGWRGARVDEPGLKNLFGETLGGLVGTLSAGTTLFDRKPVSESVAPGAISALRGIEAVLAPSGALDGRHNRMLVVGHSLGGNMLATGLKDDLIKMVRRHQPGTLLPPVLGDLVVLVNPAAEATKWTAVQREVWTRTAFFTDASTPAEIVIRDNEFFPDRQKPVVVSITAALAFPAGGLRAGDCAWIGLDLDDRFRAARARIRERLAATDTMFDSGVDYDWATHDLFPTFKFDFRPAAAYLDRLAAHFEGRQPAGQDCQKPRAPGLLAALETLPLRAMAVVLGTFPFQVTAAEESHTIGNLDPPRPAAGVLADALPSAAPFGTTHELQGHHASGIEPHHPYATLADAPIDCPLSNRWLSRARAAQKQQYGLFWDSDNLAAEEPGVAGQGPPSAQFLHGLKLTGLAPITRANDPFWNMRAFDNALSRHDGYRLSSFICAVAQLVLDDTTGAVVPMAGRMDDPDHPMVNPTP
jgi:hypothetical protein